MLTSTAACGRQYHWCDTHISSILPYFTYKKRITEMCLLLFLSYSKYGSIFQNISILLTATDFSLNKILNFVYKIRHSLETHSTDAENSTTAVRSRDKFFFLSDLLARTRTIFLDIFNEV